MNEAVERVLRGDAMEQSLEQIRRRIVHDDDFNAFRTFPRDSQLLVMDVGANRGQSIISLKTILPKVVIHAFEANPMFFGGLEELKMLYRDTLTVHRYGLGRAAGTLRFYVPWVGDTPYLEESSTRLDYFDKPWIVEKFLARGKMRLEEFTVQIRAGDEMSLSPDIVKIDVEGAEYDVLIGLGDTLQRSRPTFLVENSDWHNVTPYLAALGYMPLRWDQLGGRFVPFHGPCTNTFYFHESKRPFIDSRSGFE
jgi:FkbM family methyltransferase